MKVYAVVELVCRNVGEVMLSYGIKFPERHPVLVSFILNYIISINVRAMIGVG